MGPLPVQGPLQDPSTASPLPTRSTAGQLKTDFSDPVIVEQVLSGETFSGNTNGAYPDAVQSAGAIAPKTLANHPTSDRFPQVDSLIGMASTTSLLHDASLQRSSFQSSSSPRSLSQTFSRYSSTSGYGLVNANIAVAQAMGYGALPEISDLGGVNIGNDMVNAPDVWNQGIGGQGVTVAVIDSGVDTGHTDLNGNIWINADEVFGDGIDNDGNGYVDDVVGWNFSGNNYDVSDFDGHGTHVAGTIAAEADGRGTTGVAPGANIMPIKIGDMVDP